MRVNWVLLLATFVSIALHLTLTLLPVKRSSPQVPEKPHKARTILLSIKTLGGEKPKRSFKSDEKRVSKKTERREVRPEPKRKSEKKAVKREVFKERKRVSEGADTSRRVVRRSEPEKEPESSNPVLSEPKEVPEQKGGSEGAESRVLEEKVARELRRLGLEFYRELILLKISENRFYPPVARLRGFEGRVVLRIRVGKGGRVELVEVIRSSGYEVLDEAARQMVLRSNPFPPPPPELRLPVTLEVPIRFSLESG